ncbi:hypothetical protein CPB83DRAFT_845471 [Crepidotus variabilis]|uniref:Uncharacterized protein n=1 Tax=Crepidotus variabilis TaxID=179855 RepID=A0A9P6ERY0_9AGAR|nr:hypothetical protein CPB83DRAFT_845471 [Crepidotus variabilis]
MCCVNRPLQSPPSQFRKQGHLIYQLLAISLILLTQGLSSLREQSRPRVVRTLLGTAV